YQVSQLIKRAIAPFERALYLTMGIGRLKADTIYQIIYTLLWCPLAEMKLDTKRNTCTPMHTPEQHSYTFLGRLRKPLAIEQQLPVEGPACRPKRCVKCTFTVRLVAPVHKILQVMAGIQLMLNGASGEIRIISAHTHQLLLLRHAYRWIGNTNLAPSRKK